MEGHKSGRVDPFWLKIGPGASLGQLSRLTGFQLNWSNSEGVRSLDLGVSKMVILRGPKKYFPGVHLSSNRAIFVRLVELTYLSQTK